jgi:hypothetical protein
MIKIIFLIIGTIAAYILGVVNINIRRKNAQKSVEIANNKTTIDTIRDIATSDAQHVNDSKKDIQERLKKYVRKE